MRNQSPTHYVESPIKRLADRAGAHPPHRASGFLPTLFAAGLLFFVAIHTGHAKTETAVSHPEHAEQTVPTPPDMAVHVQACAACHGVHGEGTPGNDYFPRLAGKPAGYLYHQLVNFRGGKRRYPPMNYLTTYMSDDFLHKVAAYYASLPPVFMAGQSGNVSADVLARGQALVLHGDAARGIPACAACHGAKLQGMEPAIPGLLGLHSTYLSAQLGAWRSGNRQANAPDCMHTIASKLSDTDVNAVASWLAAQTPAPDAKPLPAGALQLPLDCGSEPQHLPVAALLPQNSPSSVSMNTGATLPADQAELIQRGKYLARAGDCVACHTVRGGALFAGGLPLPTPFGTLYSPNLTPDNKTGIGTWTADDFYRAMHHGRAKDGSFLYPAFPYPNYTKITRQDSDAIYAYLRSLPAVHRPNTPNQMPFPFNIRLSLLGWQIMFMHTGEYKPDSSKSAEWNRGAYLVEGLGHCAMCHTPINPLGGPINSAAFSGGLIPLQNWYAPSLTSDKAEGIGSWSVQDLADFMKKGVSAKGAVYGPMADVVRNSLQYLSDADIRAMAVYLKSLPQKDRSPTHMQFEVSDDFGQQLLKEGEGVYIAHCAVCHKVGGEGAPPEYPPLQGNKSITMESNVNPIRIVLNGGYPPSTFGNPNPVGMPPFGQALSDREVAAVVTYIRHAWGNNDAKAVSPQQVSELRSAPTD